MENNNFYYQESKKINPIGLIVSYAIYLVIGLLLGYAYSMITTLIPIIYINFLLAIGLGVTLGFVMRITVRLTHNRNKKSQFLHAAILGVLAFLCQWAAYILYISSAEVPSLSEFLINLPTILSPQNFFPAIAEINHLGMWSIFGITFNGFWLGFIWALEAIIIIGLPIIAVHRTKVYPYSEFLGKWYPKYTLIPDFESVFAVNQFEKELQINPLESIESLGRGLGLRHSKIHVFYHKGENKQYMTVEKVFIEGRGKGKRITELVINNFEIDKGSAQSILEKFGSKKERIAIF